MRTPARVALVLSLALVPGACDGASPRREEALMAVEALAFVPEGRCAIASGLVCANPRPLLVDRYEVTRADWLAWTRTAGRQVPHASREIYASWAAHSLRLPAAFLDLEEARAYAASRGMRLLRASEWMRIASGTRRQPWPWGYRATSVANTLELDLRRPVAVGTFEQGRTPLGTYDMIGSVWEWVEGAIPDRPAQTPHELAWVMGGSYLSLMRPLFSPDARGELAFHRQRLDPRHRAVDVGLRCAVDAEEYLWQGAASWGEGPEVQRRLIALGRSWGAASVPLLEQLVAREGAGAGLAALLEGARG